jgi:CheY-like chemotaxis protein
VGRLAGGIAHDFNNLLMVIRSYAEIIDDGLAPYEPSHRSLQAIMKAADRGARLTGQMLAFSRKQVLSPVPLDLNAAVAESAKMLRRLIGEDIDLRVNPAEPAWTVRADPDQVAQVLMNLSVNARDAMPEGGTLTIATHNIHTDEVFLAGHPYVPAGEYVALSVADTGVGMSEAVQENIFEPFFTTKEVGKGTGLGLSTVYGIVKQSGGYLEVQSEAGHGAKFTVYLPKIEEEVAGSPQPSAAEQLHRGTETLLLVEDEDALRESLREFLVAMGYKVIAAASGQEALDKAAYADHIDLMITDLIMPRMSGRELADKILRLRPGLKAIFISGYTDDVEVRQQAQGFCIAFLQKPFSLASLAMKVRELLGPRQSVQ